MNFLNCHGTFKVDAVALDALGVWAEERSVLLLLFGCERTRGNDDGYGSPLSMHLQCVGSRLVEIVDAALEVLVHANGIFYGRFKLYFGIRYH